MSLFGGARRPTGKGWVREHSLSLAIATILLLQLAFAVWSGHQEFLGQQQDHGQQVGGWGSDYWQFLAYEVNMSTLADTYGVLLIVLLSKWFYERGSAESTGG